MCYRATILFIVGLFITGFSADSCASNSANEVIVGVLAHRGNDSAINMWTPTIRYLNEEISGKEFHLLPLDLTGMLDAVERHKVDFILTNPGNYVELERRFSITRIVTLRNLRNSNPYTQFGAVIFVRAEREDLRSLVDLKNKSLGAVDKTAFGGF